MPAEWFRDHAYRRCIAIHGSVERPNDPNDRDHYLELRVAFGRRDEKPCRFGWKSVPVTMQLAGKACPLEGSFRVPKQIFNHHRIRQFRRFHGVNHVWGATVSHNKPFAFAAPPGHLPPTASVAKTAESNQRPDSRNPRKTRTFTH
jgi:hypothetical protein